MAFLDEIVVQLVGAGVGVFGTNIFISSKAVIPTGAGPYLVLVETGGSGAVRTQNGTATERPTAQLSCRANSYASARAMLQAAYAALGGANGLYNVTLNGTFYISITARQNIADIGLDGAGRAMVAYNIDAEFGVSTGAPPVPAVSPVIYQLIEDLGGDENAFVLPAISDAYPTGVTFDTLVPGSWPVLLNSTHLYAGTFYFEASARVSAAGPRVKVALFDLTNAPNVPIAGSEIVFTASELNGERKRSGAFIIPAVDSLIAAKMTVNSITIDGAAWGCRIVRA